MSIFPIHPGWLLVETDKPVLTIARTDNAAKLSHLLTWSKGHPSSMALNRIQKQGSGRMPRTEWKLSVFWCNVWKHVVVMPNPHYLYTLENLHSVNYFSNKAVEILGEASTRFVFSFSTKSSEITRQKYEPQSWAPSSWKWIHSVYQSQAGKLEPQHFEKKIQKETFTSMGGPANTKSTNQYNWCVSLKTPAPWEIQKARHRGRENICKINMRERTGAQKCVSLTTQK